MLENYSLQIIRLITNDDIIGFVSENKKTFDIKYPKSFGYSYDEYTDEMDVSLDDWLSRDFFEFNDVNITKDKVLFNSSPNVAFSYSYLKCLVEENLDKNSTIYKQIQETLKFIEDTTDTSEIVYH